MLAFSRSSSSQSVAGAIPLHSSLSYLRSFPFDKIKIDRSFVADLDKDADAIAIIRAISALGRSLGIITVAEGVETQAQADHLRAEGLNQLQGFLFSRPRAGEAIRALLQDARATLEEVA